MSVENGICCSIGDRIVAPCPHSPTGMLADRYRRMDSSRQAAVEIVADSSIDRVVRFDVDNPVTAAARAASKRAFQVGRTDAQFDREMAQREWLERFHVGLVAELNTKRARLDLEAAAAAAERRINEQWRPKC